MKTANRRELQIVVTGFGEHGKDTVCELLAPYLSFKSSSKVACEVVVFPALKDLIGYSTPQECFDDRRNHRAAWYELIRSFNFVDGTALGRVIFETCNVYCGLRSLEEYVALKEAGLVDYLIWVDASDRLPPEGAGSMTLTKDLADVVLDNNGTLAELPMKVAAAFKELLSCNLQGQ